MSKSDTGLAKIEWQGTIISIQPRSTVWRYRVDNRTHGHIGYNIFLDGEADGVKTNFAGGFDDICMERRSWAE